MKLFLIAAALLGGTFVLSVTDARAAACARGVYRVGCVGPRGAVVPTVVTPGVVCARGVYRAGCVTR